MTRDLSFYDKKGEIYCTDYNENEIAYKNTTEFINDISNLEIRLAISDCEVSGENVEKDEHYIRYKRLVDTQKISDSELRDLFDFYSYGFVSDSSNNKSE